MARLSSAVQMAFGYGVAAACLIWLLHDVEVGPLLSTTARLRWDGVALAILVDLASYGVQGYRWKLLLRPAGELSWMRSTQAIYAGLLANEILPLRPGEAVRAWLVARWLNTPVLTILPSIFIERVFDGVWLAAGMGVTLLLMQLPRELVRAADAVGATILLAAGVCLFLIARRRRQTPAGLASAFVVSLGILASQTLAFWLVMRACHIGLGFWPAGAVLLIVHLGTALPTAPANAGTYQLACVAGLVLFGVDKTAAINFSLVVFVVLTIPLIAVGAVALGRSGATLAFGSRAAARP